MKRLLYLIIIAALAWAGYWFVGAHFVRTSFATWFQERQVEGWQAEYSDLSVVGFPNRFDTTFSDIALADPNTGWAWHAPFFQILALSYKPNHVIAAWPDQQQIFTPLDKFEVLNSEMRASVVFDAGPSLPLNRMSFVSGKLAISSHSSDSQTQMQGFQLAVQRESAEQNSYKLAISAEDFALSRPIRTALDPSRRLPDSFTTLTADLTMEFDRPWDRFAIETARPQPTRIQLKLAEAQWGELHLQAAGRVEVDIDGRANGKLTIKARNWREIMDMIRASRQIPEALLNSTEQGLSLLAKLSGNPDTLDISLDFADGEMFLGPVPLGPAPLLKLR